MSNAEAMGLALSVMALGVLLAGGLAVTWAYIILGRGKGEDEKDESN